MRVEWKSKRPVEIPAKSWFQQYLCVTNLTKGASPDEECNYFINAEMHKMILAAEEASDTSSNGDSEDESTEEKKAEQEVVDMELEENKVEQEVERLFAGGSEEEDEEGGGGG